MAAVSDAMSYVYTSATPGTTPICESNFRAGNPSAAIPVIKTPQPFNSDWQKSKAYENSIATYDKLSLNKTVVFQAQARLVEILKEAAPKKDVEQFMDPPSVYVGPTIMKDGKVQIAIAKPFIPGVQHMKNISDVYRYLSVHRMARGEDNKWISPLTSGYYYGSMTRSMDKLIWKVADVLHVLRLLNLSAVYFMELPSMSICQSLAANGVIVFTLTSGPITSPFVLKEDKSILPGTYRLRSLHELNFDYLVVPPSLSSTRPVYKVSGVIFPDEEKYMDYLSDIVTTIKGKVLATCFLTPRLLNCREAILIPSIHAHAGHVLALFGVSNIREPLDRGLLVDRICTSNIFKTWFPLSRTRFYEYDFLAYKFSNFALQNMVLSVHTAKASVVATDFGPFDGELTAAMSNMVGDQTFTCNSLWTATASQIKTSPTASYQEHPPCAPPVADRIDPIHLARPSATPVTPPVPPAPSETFDVPVEDF